VLAGRCAKSHTLRIPRHCFTSARRLPPITPSERVLRPLLCTGTQVATSHTSAGVWLLGPLRLRNVERDDHNRPHVSR
jgi:hypothetical protein